MRKKFEQKLDPITGYTTLPWYGALIGGFGVYTILVSGAFAVPYPSLKLIPLLSAIGLIGSINFIWLRTKPNLFSKFIMQITVSLIFAIMSYRSFEYLLPDQSFLFGTALAISILFTHTLPIWNPSLTKFIRDAVGLSKRKTKLQRFIFNYSLYVVPIVLVLGFVVNILFRENTGRDVGMYPVMAMIGWFVAIILPISDQSRSSPWEKYEVNSNND